MPWRKQDENHQLENKKNAIQESRLTKIELTQEKINTLPILWIKIYNSKANKKKPKNQKFSMNSKVKLILRALIIQTNQNKKSQFKVSN